MKRFITTVLCVSVFFIGLGTLVEKVGAKFKSDEKALALIQAARQAIGGDAAISNIQSLRIKGKSVRTLSIDGKSLTHDGDAEFALQLPDKFAKTVRIGGGEPSTEQIVNKHVETIVVRQTKDGNIAFGKGEGQGTGVGAEPGTKVIIKTEGDGKEMTGEGQQVMVERTANGEDLPFKVETADGQRFVIRRNADEQHLNGGSPNEFRSVLLGLLLSSPAGSDVNYTYGGEQQVDGRPCNLVVAQFGGDSVKLYLDSSSNLPVMIAYSGMREPQVMFFRKQSPTGAEPDKDTMVFNRKVEGDAAEKAELQVRFSDYRSVDGVQLPFKWVTSVNGSVSESLDVTNYEINPANIADSFPKQRVFVRVPKPDQK